MATLFTSGFASGGGEPEIIALGDGELRLWPRFLTAAAAAHLLASLTKEVPWEQSQIFIGGQYRPIPRLNAWYGDLRADYRYSGTQMTRNSWSPALLALRQQTENTTRSNFNSALLNLYRDGHDSVDWHSDDEHELGPDPRIATVSLGAERHLQLRAKHHGGAKRQRCQLLLPAGSLLLMSGALQAGWQHRIAKVAGLAQRRISITFRTVTTVADHSRGC